MKKFTFHLVGLVHLPAHTKFNACAFTMKNIKLARMLTSLGHTVYFYGAEGSNVQKYCAGQPGKLIFVQTHTLQDISTSWGDGSSNFDGLGYDWRAENFRNDFNDTEKKEATKKFEAACIQKIREVAQLDHFLLVTMGSYHAYIADTLRLFLRCEPGIGYRGSLERNFRAFESSYIRNFTYGSEHPYGVVTSKFYDRVIPNYFDPQDFQFSAKKENYFLFIGRMMRNKGIYIAGSLADATGIPLKIVGQGGKVTESGSLVATKDSDFELAPGNWQYLGYADTPLRKKLMAEAKATIVATQYLEPFAGTHIESMLSGTPVITTDFGVFPETIPDYLNGKVGFRCNTFDDFYKAAKQVGDLDPFFIRDYASKFLMDNVKYDFQKWFEDLYRVYESQDKVSKGWDYHEIE